MATPLVKNADELQKYGWDVRVLNGLDHISAMQPRNVLPIIEHWLSDKV